MFAYQFVDPDLRFKMYFTMYLSIYVLSIKLSAVSITIHNIEILYATLDFLTLILAENCNHGSYIY